MEIGSPPETQTCEPLHLAQQNLVQTSDLEHRKMVNLCCYKPPNLQSFVSGVEKINIPLICFFLDLGVFAMILWVL